ncbi:MAG: hypothetical protein VW780_07670 [Actinomycetota bacterium]
MGDSTRADSDENERHGSGREEIRQRYGAEECAADQHSADHPCGAADER